MEVNTSNADTMEEILPTNIGEAEQAGRIDSFSTSPLILASPLEEGQITPHHSSLLPPTTSCHEEVQALPFSEPSFMEPDDLLEPSTQNNAWINSGTDAPTASAIDPHSQESRKLNKDNTKVVGWGNNGWRSPTEIVVDNHDTAPMNSTEDGKGEKRSDNWDSGWSSNNWVSPTAPHATLSPPAILSSAAPTTTTKETTNAVSVNSLQETPQPNQFTTEKPANNSWGSWGVNNGWGSPSAAGRAATEWSALPTPTGNNESWGPSAPRSFAAGENAVTTMTTAPTSVWGGAGGQNLKTTSRGNFEDRSAGSFGRGRGRGRGGGRGGWSGLGGPGRRGDSSPSDQPLAKSFNHSSTSFGNPDHGWGTRPRENNQTSETPPTRRYQQESAQSAWGLGIPHPPVYQAQPSMGPQVYQPPLSPAVAFQSPAPPFTTQSVLWPLHTDLTLKRDLSEHTSKIAKYQARLNELETKQRHVHSWYHSQANNLPQLHTADPETLERELNKARIRRDDNLAALKVDEKKYAGFVNIELMLLARTLGEEMVRTLETGAHELLWKMTAAAGDGRRGFDINRALEEIVKTAMPSIIERQLQRYAEAIMKATEKEYRKVEAAAPVEDHLTQKQSDTKEVSSLDLQEISALKQENTDLKQENADRKQENADLKASFIELQEAFQQLEARTEEQISSVRKEALGWTLEGNDHPVAPQIRKRFQAERDFIIGGITRNLQLAFEAVLDHHSPDA